MTRPQHRPTPEQIRLTARERRRFRQVRRGLRATDPHWFAAHCPHDDRRARAVRYSVAVLSFAFVVTGALTGVMPLVLGGVVLAVGAATGCVSSRTRWHGHA
jgi:hypothetical protein